MVVDGRADLFDAVLNGRLEIKKLRINTNLGEPVGSSFFAGRAAFDSHIGGRIFHGNGRSLIRRDEVCSFRYRGVLGNHCALVIASDSFEGLDDCSISKAQNNEFLHSHLLLIFLQNFTEL